MGFPLVNNKHFENPISTYELGLIVIICLFFKSLFTCNKVAKAVKQCSIHFLSVEL